MLPRGALIQILNSEMAQRLHIYVNLMLSRDHACLVAYVVSKSDSRHDPCESTGCL